MLVDPEGVPLIDRAKRWDLGRKGGSIPLQGAMGTSRSSSSAMVVPQTHQQDKSGVLKRKRQPVGAEATGSQGEVHTKQTGAETGTGEGRRAKQRGDSAVQAHVKKPRLNMAGTQNVSHLCEYICYT